MSHLLGVVEKLIGEVFDDKKKVLGNMKEGVEMIEKSQNADLNYCSFCGVGFMGNVEEGCSHSACLKCQVKKVCKICFNDWKCISCKAFSSPRAYFKHSEVNSM
jgi:hypothetical protein